MGEQTEARERVRDSSDPWRPTPQPECDPDCTCTVLNDTDRSPEPPTTVVASETRECGVTGCTHCDPVARWIEDTDPDPAPGGGDRLTYGRRGLR
jgi:hypothetical protein